jgi:hypothetical protein
MIVVPKLPPKSIKMFKPSTYASMTWKKTSRQPSSLPLIKHWLLNNQPPQVINILPPQATPLAAQTPKVPKPHIEKFDGNPTKYTT